jgi:hypothetical protein
MPQVLPLIIGYALWLIFVISWNVSAMPAPAIATPGARRERLYGSVIAIGLMMIVVAPFLLILPGFRMWTNPLPVAWAMLPVIAAGVALC